MEDLTGRQLGPYRVLEPLGEGGMAAVYKGYQASMDRHVAVKVLPRHFASDPSFVSRFEREARVIAQLQHVHILPVFDYGEADGYTYLAMRFVESGTLADLLAEGPISLPQVRTIISQVGGALGYAHDQGVIHRDIKPSNILIDRTGNCLLTDFGIAKMVEATVQLTQTGTAIGTPAYMSPEQILGNPLDGRSDLYSLGIVLFEMVTGRTPYRAETPPAILVMHLHDPLPMPRSVNPNVSEPVERVILKSLAKEPEDRFQGASEMVRAVKAAIPEAPDLESETVRPPVRQPATLAEEAGPQTPPPVQPPPAPPPAPASAGARPPSRENRWRWVIAGSALVALLVGIAVCGVVAYASLFGGGLPGMLAAAQPPQQIAVGEPTQSPDPGGALAADSPTPTVEASATPSPTAAPTDTSTSTVTPTATATITLTPTATHTPSRTPTRTRTPTPAPVTFSTGKFSIRQTWLGDLDNGGEVGLSEIAKADVWFEAVTATEKYISPRNGALILEWGSGAPDHSDCVGASLSSTRIPYGNLSVGDWVCYRTASGRYGRFEVEAKQSDKIWLDYRTWQ